MSWWKVAIWLIATFGIAGTIALIVFAPTFFKLALDAVVRFFTLVLSYRIGCAVVAAVLAWFIADYVRHSIEDDRHAAEVAAFEKKQVERDEQIARDTREWVLKEIEDSTSENAKTDKAVKDITNALPPTPTTGNVFRVGSDACRLRSLAGQAGCGSDGTKGVPQADAKGASLRDRLRKRLSGGGSGSAGHDQQGQ